jgi:hypothetical protein
MTFKDGVFFKHDNLTCSLITNYLAQLVGRLI